MGVDVVLNDVLGNSEKNIIVSGVKTIKKEATKIRKAGVKMAGSEKAQIIEEASLLGALAEVTGINFLLSLLGIKIVPHEEEGAVVPVAGEVVPAPTPDAGVPASPAKPIDAALVEEEELVTRTTEDELPTSSEEEHSTEEAA